MLERNFGLFAVNLPWKSFDILTGFKMAALLTLRLLRHQMCKSIARRATDFFFPPYCRPSKTMVFFKIVSIFFERFNDDFFQIFD